MATLSSITGPSIPDWLRVQRTVRFGDTDAAGVMHFHQLLRWCHEAYEESLEKFGIAAVAMFPTPPWSSPPLAVAVPIVHCRADFHRPLVCGDRLIIQLQPRQLDRERFEVTYRFYRDGPRSDSSDGRTEIAALGLTRHTAIDPKCRVRCSIPDHLVAWIEALSIANV